MNVNYAGGFSEMILWWVRIYNEFEGKHFALVMWLVDAY